MEQQKLTTNKELIGFLCESFPQCFANNDNVKPLKIGIFKDLAERLKDDKRVSNRYLRIALRHYTNSWRYLAVVKEGAQRIDLDGNEVEEVESQHAEHAALQLKESKQKAAEKRKSRAEHQKPKARPKRKQQDSAGIKVKVKQRKTKPSDNMIVRPVKQEELKSGLNVSVKLGKQPMPAVVTDVAKDGILVQLNTGMSVKVQAEQLRVANKKE